MTPVTAPGPLLGLAVCCVLLQCCQSLVDWSWEVTRAASLHITHLILSVWWLPCPLAQHHLSLDYFVLLYSLFVITWVIFLYIHKFFQQMSLLEISFWDTCVILILIFVYPSHVLPCLFVVVQQPAITLQMTQTFGYFIGRKGRFTNRLGNYLFMYKMNVK